MGVAIIISLLALSFALYDHFDSREWLRVTSPVRNNVVFEERNKKYGAYSIRRDYNDLIMIILLCLFALVGVFKVVNSSFIDKTVVTVVPDYDTTLIVLEAPPVEEIETVETPYKVVGGGGGSGTPSDAEYDPKPKPMSNAGNTPAAANTKPKKGNKETGGDSKATSKNPKPDNPFGSDGEGGGNKGGRGTGMGSDDGPGSGPGNGPGSSGGNGGAAIRKWVRTPNVAGMGDENCIIVLNLVVNADGDIVVATNVASKSTTTNSTLISQVKLAVMREGKFNAVPGAKNVTFQRQFRIEPQ